MPQSAAFVLAAKSTHLFGLVTELSGRLSARLCSSVQQIFHSERSSAQRLILRALRILVLMKGYQHDSMRLSWLFLVVRERHEGRDVGSTQRIIQIAISLAAESF